MRHDGGEQAADGVGKDSTRGELAIVHRVEHRGVGAQEAAPTHADGGEHGDGVAIDPALLDELGNQTERGTDGTEGGDGEADEVRIIEAEEPLEDETNLLAEPRQDSDALIGGTRIGTVGTGREGKNHHQRGDDEHTRDNGEPDVNTRTAAVEQGVEDAQEYRLILLVGHLEVGLGELTGGFLGILGVSLLDKVLHQAGGDDTATDGTDQTDKRLLEVAVTHHEDDDDQSHTEGGAEVGQRDELEFLEVGGKALVLGKGDNGGVIAQEGEHRTQRCHTGEVEQGLHQGTEGLLEQLNDAKLDKEAPDSARDDTDGHQEEAGVQQQVMGSVHDSVEHVGSAHLDGETAKEQDNNRQTNDSTELVTCALQATDIPLGERHVQSTHSHCSRY